MRVFIALELPEHVKAEIFHGFEKLKENGIASGNFVEKENLHLTLKFLGDVDEDKIVQVEKKLSQIKFNPFNVEVGKIGFFPNENYIRVLWVELKSSEIYDIYNKIENELNSIGFEREKEFVSHITVARIKSVKNRDIFFNKVEKIRFKKLKFEIKDFSLIKSELMKSGPVYKTIKTFELMS